MHLYQTSGCNTNTFITLAMVRVSRVINNTSFHIQCKYLPKSHPPFFIMQRKMAPIPSTASRKLEKKCRRAVIKVVSSSLSLYATETPRTRCEYMDKR